jgi:hypothetical protein
MAELSRPAGAEDCCPEERQRSCCEPSAKAECCEREDGCACAAPDLPADAADAAPQDPA